jgi:hypothetical protein
MQDEVDVPHAEVKVRGVVLLQGMLACIRSTAGHYDLLRITDHCGCLMPPDHSTAGWAWTMCDCKSAAVSLCVQSTVHLHGNAVCLVAHVQATIFLWRCHSCSIVNGRHTQKVSRWILSGYVAGRKWHTTAADFTRQELCFVWQGQEHGEVKTYPADQTLPSPSIGLLR